jgi:hypothetical protein
MNSLTVLRMDSLKLSPRRPYLAKWPNSLPYSLPHVDQSVSRVGGIRKVVFATSTRSSQWLSASACTWTGNSRHLLREAGNPLTVPFRVERLSG